MKRSRSCYELDAAASESEPSADGFASASSPLESADGPPTPLVRDPDEWTLHRRRAPKLARTLEWTEDALLEFSAGAAEVLPELFEVCTGGPKNGKLTYILPKREDPKGDEEKRQRDAEIKRRQRERRRLEAVNAAATPAAAAAAAAAAQEVLAEPLGCKPEAGWTEPPAAEQIEQMAVELERMQANQDRLRQEMAQQDEDIRQLRARLDQPAALSLGDVDRLGLLLDGDWQHALQAGAPGATLDGDDFAETSLFLLTADDLA